MNRVSLVKTSGRSLISDIRSTDIVLLAHEKNLAKGLDTKKLIDAFSKRAKESPFSEQFFLVLKVIKMFFIFK